MQCFYQDTRIPYGTRAPSYMEIHLFQLSQVETLPVSATAIEKETRRDPTLSHVWRAVSDGWSKDDQDLSPFYGKRTEITLQRGILLWGIRVIIPQKLQEKLLHELHQGHTGMVRMKALARSHVW
jgi:hypothetical protein